MDRIDAGVNPPLFYLLDLMGKKLKYSFYEEQLLKIKEEDISSYLQVDKIIKIRTSESGANQYLVNFINQPHEFQKWLSKEEFVKT